ncbi:hypothetical protein BSQ37_09785 [Pediococcus damnosus]|nr:hypothetical protein BSQ37_09785 [Pediococcus damnosus]
MLNSKFLSPHYNQRTDKWGGNLKNRLRFAMAVVDEVQKVVSEYADSSFIIGYRITLEEREDDGLRLSDTEALIKKLIKKQIGYLHLSLGNALTSHSHYDDNSEPFIQRISKLVGMCQVLVGCASN